MRATGSDLRIKAALTATLAGAALIVYLLMIPPVIGVADNGDFMRLMMETGFAHLSSNAPFADNYYAYAHTYFGYGEKLSGGYASTQVWLVSVARGIGKIGNEQVFDIRYLGTIYAILFLSAIALLVRYAPVLPGRKRTLLLSAIVACALLFVFGDIGYVAYFQSFFGEPYSLVFILLTVALAIALASRERAASWLFLLFVGAAMAVATSKIQYAPIGFIFALLALRMRGLRADRAWHWQTIVGACAILIAASYMLFATPDRLRQANLYQSLFFGVLKDSPDAASDSRSFGIPVKYAVLAGTNYFQTGTAIPQNDPILKQEVLDRLSHGDIAAFYFRHPARFVRKLEIAAVNAFSIRPLYLGNYDKAANKPPGALSRTFDGWSAWKAAHVPHTLPWVIGYDVAYGAILVGWWLRAGSRRLRLALETMVAVGMAGAISLAIPIVGDGEADLGKHLFLFNVCFDLMAISAVIGLTYGLLKIGSVRNS